MNFWKSFRQSTFYKKFKKDKLGVLCLFYIFLMIFISVFAYCLAPDNSKNANWGDLSIKSKPPGFTVLILNIPASHQPESSLSNYFVGLEDYSQSYPIKNYSIKGDTLVYTLYNESEEINIEKQASLRDFPTETSMQTVADKHIQPKTFYLGTDKAGRDYLSRMIIGSRISLSIGFVAVFISLVVGLFFGSIAGYYGGKTDTFVMWLINIVWSIPTLLLVIAITLALGKGFWQVFIAVGLTMWVEVARVVRGQIISVKQSQFVTAAKALGYSNLRILFKHVLPSVIAPIIVISAANFASAILVESGLSFLGLGAQPPTPSWGGMIKESYSDIILGKPFLALIPGMAILLLTLSFMMVGNTLRDALDVKK